MGEIYISQHEQTALKAVDARQLQGLVEQALRDERATALHGLQLSSCGSFVAECLRDFEQDLAEYAKSKSAQKRARTEAQARRAGSDLLRAVQNMQHRMEEEEKEAQLFHIDDLISPPYRFSERIDVRVSYRWRRTIEDEWRHGSLIFVHDVDMRPDDTVPVPKRKLSAAKQEQDRQEKLYGYWEYLMRLALYSVRDYLRSGGDGNAIPENFQAKADKQSHLLNNFSCDFWRD